MVLSRIFGFIYRLFVLLFVCGKKKLFYKNSCYWILFCCYNGVLFRYWRNIWCCMCWLFERCWWWRIYISSRTRMAHGMFQVIQLESDRKKYKFSYLLHFFLLFSWKFIFISMSHFCDKFLWFIDKFFFFDRCSACDAALSNWYFEKDGLLFCKDDYWAKYGESCQQCGQVKTQIYS